MGNPTLQEVKEYFKNAKEVRCLWNRKKYDISDFNIFYDELYKSYYASKNKKDIEGSNDSYVCLFGRNQYEKYAKIVSYKEPLYKLTAKEIRNAYENPEYLKDQFRECFEKDLECGKWYKDKYKNLICYNGIGNSYGFNSEGDFTLDNKLSYFNFDYENETEPSTEKEVEEALKNQSIKNGNVFCNWKFENNILYGTDCCLNVSGVKWNKLFDNGYWLDLRPTYTISEAESKFNIKIKAV